jgi:hypothetical protein
MTIPIMVGEGGESGERERERERECVCVCVSRGGGSRREGEKEWWGERWGECLRELGALVGNMQHCVKGDDLSVARSSCTDTPDITAATTASTQHSTQKQQQ